MATATRVKANLFTVPSSSSDKVYTVTKEDGKWKCTFQDDSDRTRPCPAWMYTGKNRECKHIRAVLALIGGNGKAHKEPAPKPEDDHVDAPLWKEDATPYPVELLETVDMAKAIKLLKTGSYILQEKDDGYRIQIHVDPKNKQVTAFNRKGEERTNRLTKSIIKDLLHIDRQLFLDGELLGVEDEKTFRAFDLLELDRKTIASNPYALRCSILAPIVSGLNHVSLTPTWASGQLGALTQLYDLRCEGAVLKLATAPYKKGRNGQHKKVKFWKMGSFIVMEVAPHGKDSIRLGLLDNKKLKDVGRCSAIGKVKAKVGDIVEVKYLYATKDDRVYQAELKELRDDVDRKDCTTKKQLIYKKGI